MLKHLSLIHTNKSIIDQESLQVQAASEEVTQRQPPLLLPKVEMIIIRL